MPLPPFLGPGTRINLTTATTAPPSPLGGAAPISQALSFSIQSQLQQNWCWAAVSTSVALFYNVSSGWTQCTVANRALPRNDCCGAAGSDPQKCNKPWYLDTALGVTGNLVTMSAGTLTFAQVQNEIAAGTPVGCRVGWYGGGGHFLTIIGWVVGATGTEYIELADPIYLNTQIPYIDFASAYQSGGVWSHTYLTQAVPAQVAAALGGVAAAVNRTGTADPSAIGA